MAKRKAVSQVGLKFRAKVKGEETYWFKGFFDRNWYDASRGGYAVKELLPEDKSMLENICQFIGICDQNGKEIYGGIDCNGDYLVITTNNGGDGVNEPFIEDIFEGYVVQSPTHAAWVIIDKENGEIEIFKEYELEIVEPKEGEGNEP